MDRLTLWPQLPSLTTLAPLLLSALAVLFVLKPWSAKSDDAQPAAQAKAPAPPQQRPSDSGTPAPAAPAATTLPSPKSFSALILVEGAVVAQLLIAGSALLRFFRKPAAAYASSGGWDASALSPVVFGLTRRHAVVYSGSDPSFADAVLKRPGRVLHNDPAQWDLSVKCFKLNPAIKPQFDRIVPPALAAVSRCLIQETHARPLCAALYGRLTERAPRLADAKAPWARHAGVWAEPNGVEADLYVLVRDFTTHLSLDGLCGRGLLAESPGLVQDLFEFDKGFAALLLGVPAWLPVPAVRRAVDARARVLAAIERYHSWLDAVLAGTVGRDAVPGVSQMFWDRQTLYRNEGLSMADRAPMDLALLWAMNANTSPFVFWVVAYIYADPGLVAVLRDELADHISLGVEHGSVTDLETFDADGILHRCPRLKAAYFETFRLAHVPTSVRFVAREFSVPAPLAAFDPVACRSPGYFSDAPRSSSPASSASSAPATPSSPTGSSSGPRSPALSLSSAPSVVFRAGTYLTVPHSVSQNDPKLFRDPGKFVADRFLVETPAGLKAAYGCLRPWGEGHPICKGRVFAEREVLMTVAVILSLWDVDLLDGVPERATAAGVMQPTGPCRARLRRRAAAAL